MDLDLGNWGETEGGWAVGEGYGFGLKGVGFCSLSFFVGFFLVLGSGIVKWDVEEDLVFGFSGVIFLVVGFR